MLPLPRPNSKVMPSLLRWPMFPASKSLNPPPSGCFSTLSQQQVTNTERSISPDPHLGGIILTVIYWTIFWNILVHLMVFTTPCQCRLAPEQSQGEKPCPWQKPKQVLTPAYMASSTAKKQSPAGHFGTEVLRFP